LVAVLPILTLELTLTYVANSMTTKRPRATHQGLLSHSGQISVATAIKALRKAPGLLSVSGQLRIRTLLVFQPATDKWVHLATVARVPAVEGPDPQPDEVLIGPFCILCKTERIEDIPDVSALEKTFAFWKASVPNHEDAPSFQAARTRRLWSRNEWGVRPCWTIELVPDRVTNWDRSGVQGPFFDQTRRWFAPDLRGVAQGWLDCPPIIEESTPAPFVCIHLPDCRGRFESLSLQNNQLQVSVVGSQKEFDCTIHGTDLDGQRHKLLQHIVESRVTQDLPRVFKDLSLHLWTLDGELVDSYYENELLSTWHSPILHSTPVPNELTQSLDTAREHGEGDNIEFKEWVPAVRTDRASRDVVLELLKTVVAFANADGGTLYVGVTDDGDLIGVGPQLRVAFGALAGADIGALKDEYAKCIKKFVSEGVAPTIHPKVDWLDPVGLPIMSVAVPKGLDPPYQLSENHHFTIRRGSSNRTMSKADIEAVLKARGGKVK
jgi:hypothetical protein